MRTISQVVVEVIARSPLLAEALGEGIANNAEVARRIKPAVEQMLFEEVSEGAIVMALHRTKKGVRRPLYAGRFLKQIKGITVRSNLVAFACANAANVFRILDSLSRIMARETDSFFNLSRGVHESLLIVSAEHAAIVASRLPRGGDVRKIERLSAITIRIPEDSLNVPGLYYLFLKAIAAEGISLVEIISVRTEFTIIFDEADIDRAFSVLKRITS